MTNKNKIKTPPEDRIYDVDDGFFLRAASVCVKDHNESEVIIWFKYVDKITRNIHQAPNYRRDCKVGKT